MAQGLLTAIAAANVAADYFTRAVCAAKPALLADHPAQRRGYIAALADYRTAEAAAVEVGGTVAQQRAIRTAHRRYRAAWTGACAALASSTKEAA
jgi:hypothetical protein